VFGLARDSVTTSLEAAIRNGNPAEIETVLEAAGDALSPELRQAGQAAVERLRSTAGDVIAKECRGGINNVFRKSYAGRLSKIYTSWRGKAIK
jgi:hypothetical protein